MDAKVLVFANFKGGTGKTSTGGLVGWELARKGYKVLTIDMDSQQNLTDFYLKTKAAHEKVDIITPPFTMNDAIIGGKKLSEITIQIIPNLDLIATSMYAQKDYQAYLEINYPLPNERARVQSLKPKIDEARSEYDYIILDVPPSVSSPNDAIFYAADYLLIVLQTHERALRGAEDFISYLRKFIRDEMYSDVDVLGIVPVLSKKNSDVDNSIIKYAENEFGKENIFRTHVYLQERVKRMDMTGITEETDHWDDVVHQTFSDIADEIIERLQED